MGKVEKSIEIDAPPEEVWATVTDLSRLGDWVTIHKRFPESPPKKISQGTTFDQTLRVAGNDFDVEWTAKTVKENEELAWDGKGPAGTKAKTRYKLSEKDGGTKFDYENEFELPGGVLGKAVSGPIDSHSGKEAEKSLEKLKGLLE